MRKTTVSIPTIGAIAATRALLGVGAGLLLSPKVPEERRQALGWTLLGIGLATTIPIAAMVFRGARSVRPGAAFTMPAPMT